MKFSEFLGECRENDVFKNLSIYVVSSWVLLQVISLLADPLNLPKATLTVLLIILLIGFPLYGFFIWRYQIKPDFYEEASNANQFTNLDGASAKEGIELDSVFSDTGVHNLSSIGRFQKMYFIGLGALATLSLLASFFIIRTNFIKSEAAVIMPTLLHPEISDKIAVLNFDNNTTDKNLDIVGKMAVDWIMHGITQNKVAQVISPKIIEDYSNVLKASILDKGNDKTIASYLKPSKVISGSFYRNGGKLLFQASITDEHMDKTLVAFEPVECDANEPLKCIEALNQRILGFLVTEDKPLENLQERPPMYEAFQYLEQAKAKYGDDEEYIRLVNAAIETDSTFFEAKVNKAEFYYNQGEYAIADSLVGVLLKESSTNNRQSNILKILESLLSGNNGDTYKYLLNEYQINPFEQETNASTMTVALQFVNRPQDVTAIFNEVPMGGIEFNDCVQCEFQYYIKGLADIELGNYDTAIAMLEPVMGKKGGSLLPQVLIRAYVKGDKPYSTVDKLLDNAKLTDGVDEWRSLCLLTGQEYLRVGDSERARHFFDMLLSSNKQNLTDIEDKTLKLLAQAHFYKANYKDAEQMLKDYIDRNPTKRRVNDLSLLAVIYQKNKKPREAAKMLDRLEKRRGMYKYGHVDYAFAQYYAAMGDEEKSMEHLLQAVADGKWFDSTSFHHDLFFQPFKNKDRFKEILNYWN